MVIDTGPTETRQNQPLFRVDHGVRPKNNLTEPALLEMSGNATYQESALRHLPEAGSWSVSQNITCPIYQAQCAF